MNEFDYRANLYFKTNLTVMAENKEEADRILNDTIESITEQKIKDLLSNCEQVEIKETNMVKQFYPLDKEREVER